MKVLVGLVMLANLKDNNTLHLNEQLFDSYCYLKRHFRIFDRSFGADQISEQELLVLLK